MSSARCFAECFSAGGKALRLKESAIERMGMRSKTLPDSYLSQVLKPMPDKAVSLPVRTLVATVRQLCYN